MSAPEHTPLPWHFEELEGSRQDGCGYVRCETDNLEISHHGDMGRSREENLANAALIVRCVNAHSDLVAALHEALEFIDDQVDAVDGDYGIPKPNRAMQVAREIREALAKAGVE